MNSWYNNDRLLVEERLVHRQLPANIDLLSDYWKEIFSKILIQKEPAIHLLDGEDVSIDVDGAIWMANKSLHLGHHEYSESRVVRQRLNLTRPTAKEWIDHPRMSAGAFYRSIKQKCKRIEYKNLPTSSKILYFSDNRAQSNFYHWIVESLSRLLLAEPWIKDSLLLLEENQFNYKYIKSSLEMLGFSCERVIQIKRGVRYKSKNLQVVTCSMFATGACSTAGVGAIRERLAMLDLPLNAIYLARKPALGRRIVNEILFMEILTRYGVQTIYAEDVSFDKLVAILGKTKLLISVYGAALTHAVFLPEKSHVVELAGHGFIGPTPSYWGSNYPSPYAGDYYYSLSSASNLNYHLIPCEQKFNGEYMLNSDVVVNLDLLNRVLARII
jgi:hypothetical protein